MPLPLLLVGAGLVLAGGAGAAAGAEGVSKQKKAKRISSDAEGRYKQARRRHLRARRDCERVLAQLGSMKVEIMDGDLRRFVTALEQLKYVRFRGRAEVDGIAVDDVRVAELRQIDFEAWDALKATLTGGIAGGAAGQVAVSAVGAFAYASTGAAISGLSGAAATNATLAWLGGGSLAAGGGGVAVGTAVLGGIAVAPALLIGGIVVHEKAAGMLAKAEANAAEVDEAIAKMDAAHEVLRTVTSRGDDFIVSLEAIRPAFAPRVRQLERWVKREKDFRRYAKARQDYVALTAKLAQVISALITTPLVTRGGNPTRGSARVAREARELAEELVA